MEWGHSQYPDKNVSGPSTSRDNGRWNGDLSVDAIRRCMAEQIEQMKWEEINKMITEAEKGKAKIFKPRGNGLNHIHNTNEIDDEYFLLTAHIDESLISKIQKGILWTLQNCSPVRRFCMMMVNFRWLIKKGKLSYNLHLKRCH